MFGFAGGSSAHSGGISDQTIRVSPMDFGQGGVWIGNVAIG